MILRLFDILNSLSGLKCAAIAFAVGLLSAFCQAPYDAFPILWISFPIVVWLLDSQLTGQNLSPRNRVFRAFAIGWAFGFGYFLNGFWWASLSFFVESEIFGWLGLIAIMFATAIFALFWGFAIAVAGNFWRSRWNRILLFAAAMSIAELFRSNFLPGFPWNSPGYAFLEFWTTAQVAAVIGLYGLNFLSFFIFAAPAVFVSNSKISVISGTATNLFAVLCLAAMASFGAYRLNSVDTGQHTDIQLRILQPNIPQKEKWKKENREQIIQKIVEINSLSLNPNISLHIWPESVFPYLMTEEMEIPPDFVEILSGQAHLIAGTLRRVIRDNRPSYYNSMVVIGPDGLVKDIYDKIKLMPFGEYIPLISVLNWFGLEELARSIGGLSPGIERKNFEIPNLPDASPLICYEIIFPNSVLAESESAQWLVNVTNDAWFGDSPGPYQHFAQSRLRAIEEGIPVIRSANTGISGIIDSNGRVLDKLEINQDGFIDGFLPMPHSTAEFEESRHYAHYFLIILAILVFGVGNAKSNRPAN